MIILDKSEYYRLIVDNCSKHVNIANLYEDLMDFRTHYQGGKQENVSCPWHGQRGDRRPSATIYPSSNMFYCHACGEKPLSVVDFVKKHQNCSFFEAIRFLEQKYGVPRLDIALKGDELVDLEVEQQKDLYKDLLLRIRQFERVLIDKKRDFTFESYSKIFFLFDSIFEKLRRKEITDETANVHFEALKKKVYTLFKKEI